MASPQATRYIPIQPKITNAQTQYYEIAEEDEAWIYDWLIRFLADACELATQDPELEREWFRRRPDTLPKGRRGPNSIASFVGGIISARVINPRHNLSQPQLDPLETVFDMIQTMYNAEYPDVQTVRFKRKFI